MNQLQAYDINFMAYAMDSLAPLNAPKTTHVVFATPDRAFATEVGAQNDDTDRLTVPRISLSRLDYQVDPTRFNPNLVRRVAKLTDGSERSLSSRFPVPIIIPYQMDIWTDYDDQAQRIVEKLMFDWASTRKIFNLTVCEVQLDECDPYPMERYKLKCGDVFICPVAVDGDEISLDAWDTQKYSITMDPSITNNSDLEPGEGDFSARYTATFNAEAWLFPYFCIVQPFTNLRLSICEPDGTLIGESNYPLPEDC